MKSTEINTRIAKACGWVDIRPSKRYEFTNEGSDQGKLCGTHSNSGYSWLLPEYTEDLNAMHDAEWTLFGDERSAYERALELVRDGDYIWRASAYDKAIAFCQVLDKREFIEANPQSK